MNEMGPRVNFTFTQISRDITLIITFATLGVVLLTFDLASSYFTHIGNSGGNLVHLAYSYTFPGRVGFMLTAILGVQIGVRALSQGTLVRLWLNNKSRNSAILTLVVAAGLYLMLVSAIVCLLHWAGVTVLLNSTNIIEGFPPVALTFSVVRSVVAMVLWGLLGLAAGLLIRSPFISTAVVLGVVTIIEPTLTAVASQGGTASDYLVFFPGSLNWSLIWPEDREYREFSNIFGPNQYISAALLLLYTCVLVFVAVMRTPVQKLTSASV